VAKLELLEYSHIQICSVEDIKVIV
jgi:hypothetical protein